MRVATTLTLSELVFPVSPTEISAASPDKATICGLEIIVFFPLSIELTVNFIMIPSLVSFDE